MLASTVKWCNSTLLQVRLVHDLAFPSITAAVLLFKTHRNTTRMEKEKLFSDFE